MTSGSADLRLARGSRVAQEAPSRVRTATALGLPLLAAALWTTRAWRAGPDLLFLPWNLFLAVVPWLAAIAATSARSRLLAFAAGGVWLLFLPNAPYLVTDLVHLRDRQGVPHLYDVLLFATFGLAGSVLGWDSIARVHRRIVAVIGRRLAAAAVSGVVLLAGLGVYLGRFERWNSWDALLRPAPVLADLGAALASPRAVAFTFLFAAYIGAGYGFFLARELWPGGARDDDPAPQRPGEVQAARMDRIPRSRVDAPEAPGARRPGELT